MNKIEYCTVGRKGGVFQTCFAGSVNGLIYPIYRLCNDYIEQDFNISIDTKVINEIRKHITSPVVRRCIKLCEPFIFVQNVDKPLLVETLMYIYNSNKSFIELYDNTILSLVGIIQNSKDEYGALITQSEPAQEIKLHGISYPQIVNIPFIDFSQECW